MPIIQLWWFLIHFVWQWIKLPISKKTLIYVAVSVTYVTEINGSFSRQRNLIEIFQLYEVSKISAFKRFSWLKHCHIKAFEVIETLPFFFPVIFSLGIIMNFFFSFFGKWVKKRNFKTYNFTYKFIDFFVSGSPFILLQETKPLQKLQFLNFRIQ